MFDENVNRQRIATTESDMFMHMRSCAACAEREFCTIKRKLKTILNLYKELQDDIEDMEYY